MTNRKPCPKCGKPVLDYRIYPTQSWNLAVHKIKYQLGFPNITESCILDKSEYDEKEYK